MCLIGPIGRRNPQQVWQVDACGDGGRRMEGCVRIKEQDRIGAGRGGEETVEQRGDAAARNAGEEMRAAEPQPAEEAIEGRDAGRECVRVGGEFRRRGEGYAGAKSGEVRGRRWLS